MDNNKEKLSLPPELFDNTPLKPTKVFDNLYCIGSRSVVSWAIKTEEGIILIDSMWDNHDAELIIDGMKKLSLDPHDIKYIIITHGHGDHYGGAQFIKDKFKAKIMMSKVDSDFMMTNNEGANGPKSPKCTPDIMISDGEKLKLGSTTVLFVETPGHTPGCMSLIFNVEDNNKVYKVAQWGGTGAPSELEAKAAYRKSIDHFAQYVDKENVTVEITAHLFSENGYAKLEAVGKRKKDEINPFVIGENGISVYLNDLRKQIDNEIAKQSKK